MGEIGMRADCIGADSTPAPRRRGSWYTYDVRHLEFSSSFGYLRSSSSPRVEGQLSVAATRGGAKPRLPEFGGGRTPDRLSASRVA